MNHNIGDTCEIVEVLSTEYEAICKVGNWGVLVNEWKQSESVSAYVSHIVSPIHCPRGSFRKVGRCTLKRLKKV